MTIPPALLVLATLLPALPALAAPLRDAATGLAAEPPPGYTATSMATSGAQTARMALRRAGDQDTGCQTAFVPAPQNGTLTQEALNRLVRTPGWRSVQRATLQPVYDVLSLDPLLYQDIEGVLMVAELRPRADLPPRAQELRSLFAIVETPRGRTTTVCSAEKAAFPFRRMEFEAVAKGITPPK